MEQRIAIFFHFVNNEHAADGHLIGGQCTGFVGADDRGATQGFHRRQRAHNGVLLGHATSTQSQASGNYGGETFRDGSHSQGNGNLEIVDGTLDPRSTVSRIVEVADINSPDGDTNDGDDLRQLFTEFVQFLLKRSLDFLGFRHFRTNLADGGVEASTDNNTAGFTSGDVGAREKNILFVLVDGSGVWYRFGVLDH